MKNSPAHDARPIDPGYAISSYWCEMSLFFFNLPNNNAIVLQRDRHNSSVRGPEGGSVTGANGLLKQQ
jgi:hypothetical protein